MHVSIITVLESGQHLSMWVETPHDSIQRACEEEIADHVQQRLAFYASNVRRFIVVCDDLSWSIDPVGQADLYQPKRATSCSKGD